MLHKQLNALDKELEKVVDHIAEMKAVFNAMRDTLKVVIIKIDSEWQVATPQAPGEGGEEEIYGSFEMSHWLGSVWYNRLQGSAFLLGLRLVFTYFLVRLSSNWTYEWSSHFKGGDLVSSFSKTFWSASNDLRAAS